ncbi:hypothetical protein SKAU_G00184560 [Synaphobranchus kaupii]|uniref:PX domain-containing protein n=1 Tax=Synaphobranchus kaupii TaxID=118154 RepID=A0A9Q1FCD9_SYNKA|nr:hypothetical protein SKAU_G00184560 [Synaphobranchus kaupii]
MSASAICPAPDTGTRGSDPQAGPIWAPSQAYLRFRVFPVPPALTRPSGKATNLPIFKLKESRVRRRYSDFEWLRGELERESKVVVPPLPGKAIFRQLPFRGDDGIFDDSFVEERRQGLEQFLNKVAGHPLAQNERCLHMFLQDESVDKDYTPSKVREA